MRILPAILTSDPRELERMIRQAESFTDWVQIDIMDGHFVPSQSITASHLAAIKTKLHLEVHLMALNPQAQVEEFYKAGAERFIFHFEATPSPQEVIAEARRLKLSVGLALNPETSLSHVTALLGEVGSVLFLSVHPGFYGKEFIPQVLDKIPELRALGSNLETGVDGGLKESNILKIKEAGADYACVGSAIFNHPQPRESYLALKALVDHG